MAANCHLENIKKHDISKVIWTYFSRILVCWCIIFFLSLSAIKCTVSDNKTGNINDKNCSLSILLTAMDEKLQKSYKGHITQHHVDVYTTWSWVVSPFYDLCSFWSMAVNTIDKLQFLPRRRLAKRGICRRRVSVCLCVWLSVCHTPVLYQNG